MKPSHFPQATGQLKRPPDMTDEQCAPLYVYRADSHNAFISCWKPSWKERLALLFGAPIWVWVFGAGHPPIALEADNPFKPPHKTGG